MAGRFRTSPHESLASHAELVSSLKLPKFPARDLKRALEQAASVRASNHREKSRAAEICRVLRVRLSISANRGAAEQSPAERACRAAQYYAVRRRTVPRSTAQCGGGQCRVIVRGTAEAMHGHRRHALAMHGTDEAHRRPPPSRGRLAVHMCTPTRAQANAPLARTHSPTHPHTRWHTRTQTHTPRH